MRLPTAIPTLSDLAPPKATAIASDGRLAWTHHAGVAATLFVCTLVLQHADGAFTNEYGGFPDEAAHFVTALMIHDYALSGEWSDPMGFARTFYDHYPKIGLGHWPPVFYLALAAWMMTFGTSHLAVMLFITTTTTAAAWLLYRILATVGSQPLAIAGALLFLALPLVQQYGAMVMMESAMTFLMLLAVWLYVRYLDRPTWQRGLLFGVVAAVAILTKGTAVALGVIPPLAVLFARRFDLLRRFSFWLPALIVAVLCAPWYAITLKLQQNGMTQAEPSMAFTMHALGYYAWHLVQLGGVGLAVASLVGILTCMTAGSDRNARIAPLYATAGACLLGIVALQSLVPVITDPRHLVPAAALLILFGVKGITETAGHFARFGNSARLNVLLLAGTVGVLFVTETFSLPQKRCRGFIPVIEDIVADPDLRGVTILVSSNSAGEGVAIAEIARREQRPGRLVKRASKLLSRSRWDGSGYAAMATTPEEILALLDQHHVALLLIDNTTPDYPQYQHHRRLIETIEAYPERFHSAATSPVIGQNPIRQGSLRVYRVIRDGAPDLR